MHELSVIQALLREVTRVAAAHDSQAVTGITLAIGPLSGVEPPLLARAFEVARMGSVAEHAALEIDSVTVVVSCKACGIETQVVPNKLLCGKCGTWRVDIRSGDELLLKQVELEKAGPVPAAAAN